jgi:O-antigen ligase
MTDTSIAYRIGIWRGTESLLSECFAGGIGMGEEAFRRVYPLYSLSAVETAPHTHNLYTQIMVSVGFTGFALFAALLLVFLRHVAAYSRTGKSDPAVLRYTASAGFSAIVGFLLMGMTDYVWYNSRVVLLFWMVLGLTSAAIRVGESERIEARLDGPHLEFDYKRRTAATSGRKDR